MMLLTGMALMFSAILLLGVAVILPKTPEVPFDRRRPYHEGSGSQLTRFAGSASEAVHGVLARRNVRLFNREQLENAGLRMSQADFFILVISGALVGALIGLVIGGPFVAFLFFIPAPFVARMFLSSLAGKRRAKFDAQLGTPSNYWLVACEPGTASSVPSTLRPQSLPAPRPRKCVGSLQRQALAATLRRRLTIRRSECGARTLYG
ncbi:type II secretion system protein [Arthrobacter sp. Hiyo8]|nr:type II secretion system protein [Arthrobacter sp. Hiyo8]